MLDASPPSTRSPVCLSIRGLGKTFPGTVALRDVDLDLIAGEIHGLVGQNGSGKSTLVKILSGYQAADGGSEIVVAGRPLAQGAPHESYRAGCRFVHQDLGLVDSLSITDNVSLTSGWPTRGGTIRNRLAAAEVDQALGRLGVSLPPETLVGTLSPAMRTIVAVTRALRVDPGSGIVALVLDEPTATLPQHEVSLLVGVIREVAAQGVAVMIVSHHLDEVLELCDIVTVLRDGKKVLTAPASAMTRHDLIVAMMGEEVESLTAPAPLQTFTSDVRALQCERLTTAALTDVSLHVHEGEVVGVAGLEGSGRDELLPAIYGAIERMSGTVRIAGHALTGSDPRESVAANVGLVPASRARLASILDLTARENLTLADLNSVSKPGRIDRKMERHEARRWFERLEVRPVDAIESPLSSFSGGNQQKVVFARWLRRDPVVLLLDEPTQGVDVGAQAKLHRDVLEAAERGAGVLVSSSDEDELVALCHRVLVMRAGRIATELTGSDITSREITRASLGADDTKVAS